MADEFKTLREVGHGIDGVRSHLNLYGAVFGAVVAGALAGYWFMFSKIDRVEDAVVRIETKLTSMETALQRVASDASSGRADVGDLKNMLANLSVKPQPERTPSPEEEALIANIKGVFPATKFAGLESGWVTYGDYKALAASLTDDQRQKIKSSCMDAIQSPEPFQLYLLGICAAVVNQ